MPKRRPPHPVAERWGLTPVQFAAMLGRSPRLFDRPLPPDVAAHIETLRKVQDLYRYTDELMTALTTGPMEAVESAAGWLAGRWEGHFPALVHQPTKEEL